MKLVENIDFKKLMIEDNLMLRQKVDSDRDDYIRIRKSVADVKELYDNQEYINQIYEEFRETELVIIVMDNIVIGYIIISDFSDNSIEIGCDIFPDYQNKGLAQKVIPAVIKYLRETESGISIIARVYNDNHISKHVIEKLGGIHTMDEPSEYEVMRRKMVEFFENNKMDISEDYLKQDTRHIEVYKFV